MKVKYKSLIILITLIIPLLVILNNSNISSKNDEFNDDINKNVVNKEIINGKDIKTSSYWIISPFTIDNTDFGNTDWATINSTNEWCKGKGTKEEPYIIENLVIDAGGSGCGISVNNSDVYFIIRNCTIYNSTDLGYPDAGIRLENVNNSIIINNNCSKNDYGIILIDSNYNLVSNNIVSNITKTGISLLRSLENTVKKNNIFNCKDGCVLTIYSENNLISENIVKNCSNGVVIAISSFNKILGNKLCFNNESGLLSLGFGFSLQNNISWNTLDKNRNGLLLYGTNDTIVKGNIIRNSLNTGITLNIYRYLDIIPMPSSSNNLIYANYFKKNKIHAFDNGTNNNWNTPFIGNYWDNYTGNDRGDGIGDASHSFNWGIDFFPIFENPFHTGEKIHIDDTGVSSRDWLLTSLMKVWCRGEGSKEIPYVIENLIINGSGTGSCITIGNSSMNSRIENCTVFNCGDNEVGDDVDAGVKLVNVNNGILLENNCSYNNHTGIFLKHCLNVTINNCNATYNRLNGIFLYKSNFTKISESIVGFNIDNYRQELGIYILESKNNTISENTVINNTIYGIFSWGCNNITILNNGVFGNLYSGISLSYSNNSKIFYNTVKFNGEQGVRLGGSDNNNIFYNQIINNYEGVSLTNSRYNILDNNNVSLNHILGIKISNNFPAGPQGLNNITNNYIQFNERMGIEIEGSQSNIIYGNKILNNINFGIIIINDSLIFTPSIDNLVYYNDFIGNKIHAVDNGTNNYWNSSFIGNYWDNYLGVDENPKDGIGDTPHNISGTAGNKDYLPIFRESGEPPGPPPGDDDDDDDGGDEEFDIIEFFTSPAGLEIIGVSVAVVIIIIIIKIKASGKSRLKEIERIEKLRSE